MKPIFENWRRYLKEEFAEEEQQYFGKSLELGDQIVEMFQQFLKDTVYPRHPEPTIPDVQRYLQFFTDDVEMKLGIKRLGCGKFRCGFDVGGNEIIKVDVTPYGAGREHNQDDHRLGTISLPYRIFPKAYAHSPDFSWVLLEKVEPLLRNADKFVSYFPNIVLTQRKTYNVVRYSIIIASFIYNSGEHQRAINYLLNANIPKMFIDTNNDEDVQLVMRAFTGRNSETYNTVLNVINQFGMRPEEVALRNTGVGSDDRFIILDSSVDSAILRGFAQKAPTPPSPAAGAETLKL
jgi:hypothetical protein